MRDALRMLHRPKTIAEGLRGRERLAYEELLFDSMRLHLWGLQADPLFIEQNLRKAAQGNESVALVYERRVRGVADRGFLEKVFHKLLLNFTWWVNRKDDDGRNHIDQLTDAYEHGREENVVLLLPFIKKEQYDDCYRDLKQMQQ